MEHNASLVSDLDYNYNDTYVYQSLYDHPYFQKQIPIYQKFNNVFGVFVMGVLSLYGILTNIINLMVFRRQGIFSDSCTVNLAALTVSDLICCITAALGVSSKYISNNYGYYSTPSIPFNALGYEAVFSVTPMTITFTWSALITCNLSLERCISVVYPFKVKSIFTPLRTAVINSAFLFFSILWQVPDMSQYYFIVRKHPTLNYTAYLISNEWGSSPRPISMEVVKAASIVYYFVINPGSIIFVLICNSIISKKVRTSVKFKARAANPAANVESAKGDNVQTKLKSSSTQTPVEGKQEGNETNDNTKMEEVNDGGPKMPKPGAAISKQDRVLLRMVKVLSALFIVCHSVAFFTFTYRVIVEQITPPNQFPKFELFMAEVYLAIFSNFFDFFIAIVNFNVYMTMSGRFRKEFRNLFCKTKTKNF